jgi:hypothetical protein
MAANEALQRSGAKRQADSSGAGQETYYPAGD